MKEKYELIGHGDFAHYIRKYKKYWWNKWQIEMDGTTPKIYLVDQKHCFHNYEFVETMYTLDGIPMLLFRCTKCGDERAAGL